MSFVIFFVKQQNLENPMRVSRQKFTETRARILATAAKLFREKGFDGIGLADIMKTAGLTHGGFYKHFDSKEDLEVNAVRAALAEGAAQWRRLAESGTPEPLGDFVERYLAPGHRDNMGEGCVLAALGVDVARQSDRVRSAFGDGLNDILASIAKVARGDDLAERRQSAIAIIAELVGGLVLARAVDDPAFSHEILAAAARDVSSVLRSGRITEE